MGRNEKLLEGVRNGLESVDGNAGGHTVLVGDVGDGNFWEGVKREVSLPSVNCHFLSWRIRVTADADR